MRAVSIVGPKKSGKTTLGLELAIALSDMGLKVAVAKHTNHGFDKDDTDTGRYREICAGVIGLSPKETMVSWSGERFLPDLVPLVDADVVLVEGGKSFSWLPRIITLNGENEVDGLRPELAIASYGPEPVPGVERVKSIEELARLVMDKGFMLPGLDCGACDAGDCKSLAERIVRGEADTGDCKSMNSGISVKVDGRRVALNPFVEGLMGAVLDGILKQLKGYTPGRVKIELDT